MRIVALATGIFIYIFYVLFKLMKMFLGSLYTILLKVLGHPLLMNRFDYFSNFYEYKS